MTSAIFPILLIANLSLWSGSGPPMAGTPRPRPAAGHAPGPKHGNDRIRLDVLFHTDLFGRYRAPGCHEPTEAAPHYGRLLGAIRRIRQSLRVKGMLDPVVVTTGNLFGPDVFGEFAARRPNLKYAIAGLLSRAGYDAVALGRYDWALGALVPNLARKTGLPLLKGNVTCAKPGDPRCKSARDGGNGFVLLRRGGLKIAVASLQAPDLVSLITPRGAGLKVREPSEYLRHVAHRARQSADVFVLLSDLDTPYTSPRRLLALLRDLGDDGPDLVISNSLYDPIQGERAVWTIRRSDGRVIASTGRFSDRLGHAVLSVDRSGRTRVRVERVEILDIRHEPPLPGTESLLNRAMTALCQAMDAPIGTARFARPHSRSDFIYYTVSVLRVMLHSELAALPDSLFSEGGFPLSGKVTKEKIHRAIRFDEPVVRLWVKGSWVKKFLKKYLTESRPRLWLLGLSKKGAIYYVNGRVLEPDQHYLVATVLPLAEGAEGLLPKPKLWKRDRKKRRIRELLEEFFAKGLFRKGGSNLVDLKHNFVPLNRKFLLGMGADVTLSFTDVAILRPGLYTDQPQLNRQRLMGLLVDAKITGQAVNVDHSFKGSLSVKYGKTKTWTRNELTGLDEENVAETDDLVNLSLSYRFSRWHRRYDPKKWWHPIPFLQWYVETELTPSLLGDDGKKYRYAETAGFLGLSFLVYPKLYLKVGAVSRSHNILIPDERTGEHGLYLGMELERSALLSKPAYKLYLESVLDFTMVRPQNSEDLITEALLTTKLAFSVIDHLFFTVSHELYLYDTREAPLNVASNLSVGIQMLFDLRRQLY